MAFWPFASAQAPGDKRQIQVSLDLCEALAAPNGGLTGGIPKSVKIAAARGRLRLQAMLGEAGEKELNETLLAQLSSLDKDFFNVGLAAARELPGKSLMVVLTSELDMLPPDRRASCCCAHWQTGRTARRWRRCWRPPRATRRRCGKRRSTPWPGTAARRRCRSCSARRAAKTRLPRRPRWGLAKTLKGKEVNAAIVARLAAADAKTKVVLLGLVGAREMTAAEPAVLHALADADPAVRLAAIGTLGRIIRPKDVELLADLALNPSAGDGRGPRRTAAGRPPRRASGTIARECWRPNSPGRR